jgi:hypothetical protein
MHATRIVTWTVVGLVLQHALPVGAAEPDLSTPAAVAPTGTSPIDPGPAASVAGETRADSRVLAREALAMEAMSDLWAGAAGLYVGCTLTDSLRATGTPFGLTEIAGCALGATASVAGVEALRLIFGETHPQIAPAVSHLFAFSTFSAMTLVTQGKLSVGAASALSVVGGLGAAVVSGLAGPPPTYLPTAATVGLLTGVGTMLGTRAFSDASWAQPAALASTGGLVVAAGAMMVTGVPSASSLSLATLTSLGGLGIGASMGAAYSTNRGRGVQVGSFAGLVAGAALGGALLRAVPELLPENAWNLNPTLLPNPTHPDVPVPGLAASTFW